MELGDARSWWQKMSSDIAKFRGESALADLRSRMNRLRHEGGES